MKALVLSLTLSAVLLVNPVSAQTPGSLDTTFGIDGKVTASIGTASAFARSLAVQNDGKIVIAGYSSNGTNNDFTIIRLLASGVPDNAFGNNGTAITDFNNADDFANAVAIEPGTGKIMVAGYSFTGSGFDFSLACYLPDGTLDNAFGNNGKVITPLGATSFSKALAIQADGKIVIGGYTLSSGQNQFALVRYNNDGTLDTTFNSTGIVIIPFASTSAVVNAMVLQPGDDKIILAGEVFNDTNLRFDFGLARFNSDGTLDNSFDADGRVTTIIGNTDNFINAVALQTDGKIVAAGNSNTSPSDNNLTMARYNMDGSLDAAFGTGGILSGTLNTTDNQVNAVVIQPDGKIITAGFVLVGNADNFALARFVTNGNADNTFGNNGQAITPIGQNDGINTIALQPDGKLVAAGNTFTGTRFDFAIARYETGLSTGIKEINQPVPVSVYPSPVRDHAVLTYFVRHEKHVQVQLRDAKGIDIATLKDRSTKSEGKQEELIYFPAGLPAGNYYIVVNSDDELQVVKTMLVK